MNDELQNALIKMIEGVENVMPSVLEEVIKISIASHLIGLALCLFMAGAYVRYFSAFKAKMEKGEEFAYILFYGGWFMAGAGITLNTINLIKIWIAPKVYLIEYAANLAK